MKEIYMIDYQNVVKSQPILKNINSSDLSGPTYSNLVSVKTNYSYVLCWI